METPLGASYKTPEVVNNSSPGEILEEDPNVDVVDMCDEDPEDGSHDSPASAARSDNGELPLTWLGYSSLNLHHIWRRATDIISKVIDDHVVALSLESESAQKIILDVAELLNRWGRPRERREASSTTHRSCNAVNQEGALECSGLDLDHVIQSIKRDLTSAKIDRGLLIARRSTAPETQAAEALLLAIISKCEGNDDHKIQLLKARSELLKLLKKLNRESEYITATELALDSLDRVWRDFDWCSDEEETFIFITAALELLTNAMKCGCLLGTRKSLREVSQKASDKFGVDDDRTVGILISIGLVYQALSTWDVAEE